MRRNTPAAIDALLIVGYGLTCLEIRLGLIVKFYLIGN
jgi:hypothetical protein